MSSEETIPIPTLQRQPSLAEEAISQNQAQASLHIQEFREIKDENTIRGLTDLPDFTDVVFVGHTATDMDSIGSYIYIYIY